jgi:UTP--glucose-1-phosphate uridylyltransferase
MLDVATREDCAVVGVMNVPASEVGSYGIVETSDARGRVAQITRIVEKPKPGATRSRRAVVGRYVLTPRIFHHLTHIPKGAGGEVQLTDAIAALLLEQRVLAYEFEGRRFDCGSKLGYLEATVELALKHPDLAAEFAAFLATHRGP